MKNRFNVIGVFFLLAVFSLSSEAKDIKNEMSITVYNPTGWDGPGMVEVPVGKLAAPGIVDWRKIKLMSGECEVPYMIREGRAHWKSRLTAPVKSPRAEDLIVFSCVVPAKQMIQISVVAGTPKSKSVLTRKDGKLLISYPNLSVSIDVKTAMLDGLSAFGEQMLNGKLDVKFFKMPEKGLELNGYVESVPPPSSVTITNKESMDAPVVKLVSSSSGPAMTEINFVLDSRDRLALALSYRVHSSGLIEIWSDERPWKGKSPWMDHAVEYNLQLSGDKEPFYYPLNRAPHYGFRDFTAVVKYADTIYKGRQAMILELGEQTVNGRRWNWQLYTAPISQFEKSQELVTLANEGYSLEIKPISTKVRSKSVQITYPKGAAVAAGRIADALNNVGVQVVTVESNAVTTTDGIILKLVNKPEEEGIEGDGFKVEPGKKRSIVVSAGTQFGLMQAGLRVAKNISTNAGSVYLPLIAENPVVDLRAGGFGGGNYEVDFPYGSDDEWKQVFDGMIESGMNIMTSLGMWGNWKMPISYKYMPEIRPNSTNEYDESCWMKMSEYDKHHEHGLKLLNYLHDRGVKVWQWIPIGCVPTTYVKAHPEAMSPNSDKIPCSTHPLYQKYIETSMTELLETYSLDGVVMIRDDNGGKCECERCKIHVKESKTKNAAWEQYLNMYNILRAKGFKGQIAVYPYFDGYQPALDNLLPEDMYIVGHGSGRAVLTRNFEYLGTMPDTWIDNLFAGFRLAPSTRMKRLLADRGSFWIGGAYCGTELPWESIGYFGWEPTSSVNTFRYQWGCREFGQKCALNFLKMNSAEEQLWGLYQVPTHPVDWFKLSAEDQARVSKDSRVWLDQFRMHVNELAEVTKGQDHTKWFAHIKLFGTYFDYSLRHIKILSDMNELIKAHKQILNTEDTLPENIRSQLIAMSKEVYVIAERYDQEASTVPGDMIAAVRASKGTKPYKEIVNSFGGSFKGVLSSDLFSGKMMITPTELSAGQNFKLKIELRNTGLCPWIHEAGHWLEVQGDSSKLKLPVRSDFQAPETVFGDKCVIELTGTAPKEPGESELTFVFHGPKRRDRYGFIKQKITLRWK